MAQPITTGKVRLEFLARGALGRCKRSVDGHTFHPPEEFLASAKPRIAFYSKTSNSENSLLKPGPDAGHNWYSINPLRLSWRLWCCWKLRHWSAADLIWHQLSKSWCHRHSNTCNWCSTPTAIAMMGASFPIAVATSRIKSSTVRVNGLYS